MWLAGAPSIESFRTAGESSGMVAQEGQGRGGRVSAQTTLALCRLQTLPTVDRHGYQVVGESIGNSVGWYIG